MSQRIIAIGDVHGCGTALDALLAAIQPTATDLVIPLGDYIDRGPSSRQVIERLIQLREQCHLVPLLGNHELMLLTALEYPTEQSFWLECGGRETLESYGGQLEQIPDSHLDFMRNCRPFFETPNHLFVHANYRANLPLDKQPSQVLFWEHLSYDGPERHMSGKTAVVGHTPQMDGEILDRGHVIGLDTWCVGGGWLSALDVNRGTVWQADRGGKVRGE